MTRPILWFALALLALAAVGGITRAALDSGPQSLEARTQAVAATLRCPTCDNLSVADSPEAMAASMRAEIADQLRAGRAPDDVRAWFVERYGPWVLLNPPREGVSLLVWLSPIGAVTIVAAIAAWLLRGRRRATGPVDADVQRLLSRWRHRELTVADSPAGERVEAALRWLDHEQHPTHSNTRSWQAASEEVAAAWNALEHQRNAPTPAGRTLGWGAGAVVLFVAIAAALPTAIAARGVGDVATGLAPGGSGDVLADPRAQTDSESPPPSFEGMDTELLTDLEQAAAATDDPHAAADAVMDRLPAGIDAEARLHIALAALQDQHLATTEALAVSVLADDPDDLEAMLLRGLALTAHGDSTGKHWLDRFTHAAPSDHPAQPLAEAALADHNGER